MSYINNALSSLINGEANKHLQCDSKKLQQKVIYPHCYEEDFLRFKGIGWYEELRDLFTDGASKRVLSDLIVHGSYGDFTQTCFSDLELTVVVTDECFKSSAHFKLLKKWIEDRLNPFLINVDPLQHHSCFFLWNDSICCYDENYLPISAYEACWSISGEKIEIQVIKDTELGGEAKEKLKSTIVNLERCFSTHFRYGVNLYSIKRVLSNFFMIPVYLCQAEGLLISKKSALKKLKNEPVSDSLDKAINIATEIRNQWPKQKQWKSRVRQAFIKSKIPQGRLDLVVCNLFRDSEVRSRFEKEFFPSMQVALQDLRARYL